MLLSRSRFAWLVWSAWLVGGAVTLSAAEKWPLAPDASASPTVWQGLDGKSIEFPAVTGNGGAEIVCPATGAPVLLTGHATGSTNRDVWSLTDFTKIGALTGRFDTTAGNFAISPDGKLITAIKKKNFSSVGAEVWSIAEGKKLKVVDMGTTAEPVVWSGFVSPTTLLTFHQGEQGRSKVRLIDVSADQPATEIDGPQNVEARLSGLSPGGHLLAVGLKDGHLAVIDLRDKQSHKSIKITAPKDFGKCIGLKFSSDGAELGGVFSISDAATRNGEVAIAAWNLSDGQLSVELKEVELGVTSETAPAQPAGGGPILIGFDWLPDGSAVLLGNKTLVDRDTGHVVWRLKLPTPGFEKLAPVFLGTDHLLIPHGLAATTKLEAFKLPWKEIDSGLQALQSNAPAWLQPGDKVSLAFEFGGLRFQTPDQVKTALTAKLQGKLQEAGFDVADNQPVTLKVAYAESSSSTLQKREDGFPFPGSRIRPPGFPPGFGPPLRRRGVADEGPLGTGTAFIIHADGYLLTCAHVVGSAPSVQVKIGDQTYHGRVVAKNVPLDFALLKVEVKNLPVLPLSDSTRIELGEEVRAMGYPISSLLGESIKATRGTLAGVVKKDGKTMFQVDASINPGNSGGPLVNDFGEVVGINSAKLIGADVDNVGFSIPINEVKAMLQEQKVAFQAKGSATKLAGPELIKRVTPAVAFVTSTGGVDVGLAGSNSVVVTRIACLISLMVKDHPEPVWTEQIVIDPNSLRVQGQLTEQKARDIAFESLTQWISNLSLPYYISKDATPVTLPVVTDLTAVDQQPQPVSSPRKTRRGLSN